MHTICPQAHRLVGEDAKLYVGDNVGRKPLFRWTLGNVYHFGYEICVESVRLARRFWGDKVDYVVVCNGLSKERVDWLVRELGEIVQFADGKSLPFPAVSYGWKYYPPRLRLGGHELFIDNDLVLLQRSSYIDKFLSGDYVLYNEDCGRYFEDFEGLVRGVRPEYTLGLNGGLFGYPPGYDIRSEILKVCSGWRGHLSEQGLTAYLLLRYENRVGIPMPLVYNHNYGNSVLATYRGRYPKDVHLDGGIMGTLHGFHFIGANRGAHVAWDDYKYKCRQLKLL